MTNTLTLISKYLYKEHPDIAREITELPEFDAGDREYLITKEEVKDLANGDLNLNCSEIIRKMVQLGANEEKVKNCIITTRFHELLYFERDQRGSLAILEEVDLNVRENLTSLLINEKKWAVKDVQESRYYLVENLFKLVDGPRETLEDLLNDAHSFKELRFPSTIPDQLKNTLKYHTNEVWFIKYSPNGKYLATGSKDTKIIVYDASNDYKLECVFQLHTESITYITWNDTSTALLSLSFDQSLRIWSIKESRCLVEIDRKSGITNSRLSCASFLGDDELLVASNDGKLFIVSTKRLKVVKEFKSNIPPQIQDFVILNSKVYAITLNQEFLVFSLDLTLIHKMDLEKRPTSITSVGEKILINLRPGGMILLNVEDIPFIESFYALPIASTSNFVVRGTGGVHNGHLAWIISGGRSGEIWIWGNQGNILRCLQQHSQLVNCVSFRPGTLEWASASDDGTVCIWGV